MDKSEPVLTPATVHLLLGDLKSGAVDKKMGQSAAAPTLHPQQAKWLIRAELGALAHDTWRGDNNAAFLVLQQDYYSVVAQNSLHNDNLMQVLTAFSEANVPVVLLKGILLSHTTYPTLMSRTMSDIDLWVHERDMDQAISLLGQVGFLLRQEKSERPLPLQQLSYGEVTFYRQAWVDGLVELHYSAFAGWWLQRTANVDHEGVWKRTLPIVVQGLPAKKLTPEDNLIQLAIHIAVNHQFSEGCLRSLMDIALVASVEEVDWELLVKRCREWRVGTAVWMALQMAGAVYSMPAFSPHLQLIQPPTWRHTLLQKFVTADKILATKRVSDHKTRFIFLLLLTDRVRDMGKLIFRSLIPEETWRTARYGQPTSIWQHWRQIIKNRGL